MRFMKRALLLGCLLLASPALAQGSEASTAAPTTSSPDLNALPDLSTPDTIFTTATIWGGPATEVYILPGLSAAVSFPVMPDTALRLGAEAILVPRPDVNLPLPVVNADVLFGEHYGDTVLYAGPSVGTVLGAAWLLGGVAGVQRPFGDSPVGWYAETRLRFGTDFRNAFIFLPGVSVGLTVRF